MECTCKKCIECCWHNPGWFGTIEEIETAAKIMNLSVEEFCREYLIREWWAGEEGIYIPAPRRNFDRKERVRLYADKRLTWEDTWGDEERRNGKGFVEASWGHNLIYDIPCIFLDRNDRCKIYEGRSTECRETFGCKEKETSFSRKHCLQYWKERQDWVHRIMQLLKLDY